MYDVIKKINDKIYKVGIYIRLSREDDNTGESESITNQRDLLTRWVNDQGYIIKDIYIDDGYSGTNFDRPAFKRMIDDVEKGLIDMIITKDISRLGRDYIGIGEYTEKYFPDKKIRYIALTDGFDTAIDSSNNDMLPFKAVFNDMYAKDISKKIRVSLRTKQREGKWVGGCPPLGYMIDPNDKNHLVPNPDEDYIVKKIFELADSGERLSSIQKYLIDNRYPTRTMLNKGVNRRHATSIDSANGLWSFKSIKGILTNELYTGTLVQNRRSKINYKVKKVVSNPRKDWIIVEGTHEPLVDKKTFLRVSEMLPKINRQITKKQIRLLDGLLFCYECKHSISINNPRKVDKFRTYMSCNYYRKHSRYKVCTPHAFNYDVFESVVLKQVKAIIEKYLDNEALMIKAMKVKTMDVRESNESKLSNLERKYEISISNLDKMYCDKLEDRITQEMFDRVSKNMYMEQEELKEEIAVIKQKIDNSKMRTKDKFDLNKFLTDFITLNNVSREMIVKLIERIDIHQDKQIDIYFNFKELN